MSKSGDIAPKLENINLSYIAQNHSSVTILTHFVYRYHKGYLEGDGNGISVFLFYYKVERDKRCPLRYQDMQETLTASHLDCVYVRPRKNRYHTNSDCKS